MSYADEASNENESEWVPAAASVNVDNEDAENQDEFGAQDFRSQMILRDDHEVRSLPRPIISSEAESDYFQTLVLGPKLCLLSVGS